MTSMELWEMFQRNTLQRPMGVTRGEGNHPKK